MFDDPIESDMQPEERICPFKGEGIKKCPPLYFAGNLKIHHQKIVLPMPKFIFGKEVVWRENASPSVQRPMPEHRP